MKRMLLICAFTVIATAWAETPYWDETQYAHKDLAQPAAVEGTGETLSLDGWICDAVPSNILAFFSSMAQGFSMIFR